MTARVLFALVFVVSGWQTHDEVVERIRRLAGEHYDTVLLYKQGQIDAALQRLSGQRYLIAYTPAGALTPGWHPIEVRVKGRRVDVRARRGYSR